MCLMKECLKHIESVPQEGWTTSLISTWGITCSTVIGQQIKNFTTGYVSSIFIPFVTTLIQTVRQRLPDTADQSQTTILESKTSHDSCLRQLCGITATNCILETVSANFFYLARIYNTIIIIMVNDKYFRIQIWVLLLYRSSHVHQNMLPDYRSTKLILLVSIGTMHRTLKLGDHFYQNQ